MKTTRIFILLSLIVVLAFPVLAQNVAPSEGLATISYNGISFSYDPALLGAVLPMNVAEVAYTGDMPPGSFYPAHTAFVFVKGNTGDTMQDLYLYPTLDVYSAADVEAFADPEFPDAIHTLNDLIEAGSDDFSAYEAISADSSISLPHLPPIAAVQVIRAQASYVSFEGGTGIRYLTYYSQSVDPISEGQISYTFQGVTTTPGYYIAFTMPVTTGILPIDIAADFDYNAFSETYDQYLADTNTALNTVDGSTFTPTLAALDALIASIHLEGIAAE